MKSLLLSINKECTHTHIINAIESYHHYDYDERESEDHELVT